MGNMISLRLGGEWGHGGDLGVLGWLDTYLAGC